MGQVVKGQLLKFWYVEIKDDNYNNAMQSMDKKNLT